MLRNLMVLLLVLLCLLQLQHLRQPLIALTAEVLCGLHRVRADTRRLGHALTIATLALSGTPGTQKVSLDDAIRAMRLTAQGMRNEFKETSLSGLATSVPLHIPVSVPDC